MDTQNPSNNIILIGYMGTGKSTIARAISEKHGFELIEMDETIEAREGMKISEIFATKGEEYFRNLETELLIELQGKSGLVISCGGGVPMREQNIAEMKKLGTVILLYARPEIIYERIKGNKDRPLLKDHMSVEYIKNMMLKRSEKYDEAADYVMDTSYFSVEDICFEIMLYYYRNF